MQCLPQTNATFAVDISVYSFSQVKVMPANNVLHAWPVWSNYQLMITLWLVIAACAPWQLHIQLCSKFDVDARECSDQLTIIMQLCKALCRIVACIFIAQRHVQS